MYRISGAGARARTLALALALPFALLPTMAVQAVTPADSDQMLRGALLTAEDLPAGMTSDGVTDGARFEIDASAYHDNGGLGITEQTWSASAAAPVYRFFDFRMLFSSPQQAQAYLDAAEPALSEVAASGLKPVSGGIAIGDGYRHYALETVANEETVELQNILFRVGPMVAKVFVGGFGTTDEDVAALARAAHARMTAVLPGPDVTAPPSPAASPLDAASPSVAPSPDASVAADGFIHQWAATATASSEYESDSWSSQQASGSPDTLTYGDNQTAWAPSLKDGTAEWLDLRYDQAVVPANVSIHESDGNGFVTKVEAYDAATSTWVTLWQGSDPTATGAVGTLSPPLAPTDVAVDRIRVSIDTSVPDWNEIDAVELVGNPPS